MIYNFRCFIILLLTVFIVDIAIAGSDRAILEQCRYIFDNETEVRNNNEKFTDVECTKYMNLMKEALQVGSILGYTNGLKDAGLSEVEIERKTKNSLEIYPSIFGICYYNSDGNRSDIVKDGFNEKEIRLLYNYMKEQPENSKKPVSYLYLELMRTMFPLNTGSCSKYKNPAK